MTCCKPTSYKPKLVVFSLTDICLRLLVEHVSFGDSYEKMIRIFVLCRFPNCSRIGHRHVPMSVCLCRCQAGRWDRWTVFLSRSRTTSACRRRPPRAPPVCWLSTVRRTRPPWWSDCWAPAPCSSARLTSTSSPWGEQSGRASRR